MKGRKRTPKAIALLEGTYRPDRDAGKEPEAASGAPEPPDCLDQEALTEWVRVCGELVAMGTLARIDRALLSAYCSCWSRWQTAEQNLKEMGAVVRGTSGGAILNPYFSVSQRCLKELRALAAELGLSATSRARLRVAASISQPDAGRGVLKRNRGSKWAGLIG